MRAFAHLYLASLREWRRDSTALLWSMAFPIVLALAIGVIFSSSGYVSFRVSIVNEDGAAGKTLADGFRANAALEILEGNRQDELAALKKGQRDAVVVIPAGAEAALADLSALSSDPIALEVHYDPDSANAQGVLSVVQQTLTSINARLTGTSPVLTMRTETASARRLSTADYMLPGVLAMSLMLMGVYVTAIPLVTLREKQVLRRMGATPLSRTSLLVSQVAFRVTVALIQALVIVALSVGIFDLPLRTARLPAVVAVVLLGAALFITLGYCLAGLSRTEEAVQVAGGLSFLVFALLSGSLIPLWRIPNHVQPLVDAIPLTYLSDALRQIMVSANGAYSMPRNILALAIWLVVCTVLALRLFRWEPQG